MTDHATDLKLPPETRAIVQRRLIGLAVLMVVAFLLSLLLRVQTGPTEALPSVVIPLNGGAAAVATDQPPVLGQEPPPGRQAQAPDQPEPVAPAASVSTPLAVEPAAPSIKPAAPAKPAVEKASTPSADPPSKPRTERAAAAPQVTAPRRWFVVVGAYKDPLATKAIANRVKLAGFRTETTTVTSSKGERLNRVSAGPFNKMEEAEAARAALIVEGLTKAVVTGEK